MALPTMATFSPGKMEHVTGPKATSLATAPSETTVWPLFFTGAETPLIDAAAAGMGTGAGVDAGNGAGRGAGMDASVGVDAADGGKGGNGASKRLSKSPI